MCDCGTTPVPTHYQSSVTACEAINVDILRLLLQVIVCGLQDPKPERFGTTYQKLNNSREVLDHWIIAKEKDPKTCEYYEHFSLIQQQVNLLLIHNVCK